MISSIRVRDTFLDIMDALEPPPPRQGPPLTAIGMDLVVTTASLAANISSDAGISTRQFYETDGVPVSRIPEVDAALNGYLQDATPAALAELRRHVARRCHPDLLPPALREAATRGMAELNAAIDNRLELLRHP